MQKVGEQRREESNVDTSMIREEMPNWYICGVERGNREGARTLHGCGAVDTYDDTYETPLFC